LIGGIERRLDRLLRDDVLGPGVARRIVAHRAGGVDQDRDGGAETLFDLGLIRSGGFEVPAGACIGRPVTPAVGPARQRQRHQGGHRQPDRGGAKWHVYTRH